MAHDHCDHDHHHSIPPESSAGGKLSTAFKISIFLNIIFVAVEILFGYISNSMSLLADAFHNLSDVFSLVIALVGFIFYRRANGKKISAGISIFNSTLLILTVLFLILESIDRFHNTEAINNNMVMLVATFGIIINFASAYLFKTHQHHDLNAEGAYLHLMADAAISLGVVISALLIKWTGFIMLDAIISIVICIIILYSSFKLLKKSIKEYRTCT